LVWAKNTGLNGLMGSLRDIPSTSPGGLLKVFRFLLRAGSSESEVIFIAKMETKIYRLQRQIARERELKISNTQSSKLPAILADQARQKHALILAKHRIIWNESYLYFADKVYGLLIQTAARTPIVLGIKIHKSSQ
jgi:hypothetical protein